MSIREYKITVDDLKGEAERISGLSRQEPIADANDRVCIANYEVGAALSERLEALIAVIRKGQE